LSWLRGMGLYQQDWQPEMQWISGGSGIWRHMYRIINTSNMLLERSENPDVVWGGVNDAENEYLKTRLQSHAYLFRAWAYRHLVLTFGDVPVSTEEINGSNFKNNWRRQPIADVRALIISDLHEAEKGLPDNSNNVLALSKAVAQHYLAEMYLWDGNPAQAIIEAQKVLDNPNYQ